MTTSRQGSNRFATIEAIRGLASVLVVFAHTAHLDGFIWSYVFDPGKIGVVIFFFISGYLVIPSAARDGAPLPFLLKRLFRLYPLYWLSLAVALALWPDRLSPAGWLANLTMAQQLVGFDNAISVYWTLTIEFCLYVLITSALVFSPDVLRARFGWLLGILATICLAAAVVRWTTHRAVPVAIPLGLFCMFIGAEMRRLSERADPIGLRVLLYVAVVIPTCLLAYSFSTRFEETGSRYVVTYLTGGAVFLLFLKFPHVDLNRGLRLLGDYSYGIYLFHLPVAFIFERWFPHGGALFLLTLVATTLVSAPLYHLVERPLAELGRQLGRRAVLE